VVSSCSPETSFFIVVVTFPIGIIFSSVVVLISTLVTFFVSTFVGFSAVVTATVFFSLFSVLSPCFSAFTGILGLFVLLGIFSEFGVPVLFSIIGFGEMFSAAGEISGVLF
jgi:hypothetical protein